MGEEREPLHLNSSDLHADLPRLLVQRLQSNGSSQDRDGIQRLHLLEQAVLHSEWFHP